MTKKQSSPLSEDDPYYWPPPEQLGPYLQIGKIIGVAESNQLSERHRKGKIDCAGVKTFMHHWGVRHPEKIKLPKDMAEFLKGLKKRRKKYKFTKPTPEHEEALHAQRMAESAEWKRQWAEAQDKNNAALADELAAQYEGFSIQCMKCGSYLVEARASYSWDWDGEEEAKELQGIELVCRECRPVPHSVIIIGYDL